MDKYQPSHLRFLFITLKYMLLAGAILYLVVYVVLALKRINYPFELEMAEGALVDHIQRILSGKQLYVAPSIEFTPYLYAPLYLYTSALVAKVIGNGFLPLRLVSFISSIGCIGFIFQFVRRETKSTYFGIVSAGFFAGTYKISGTWFDVGRVDTLFIFLVIACIYLFRFNSDFRSLFFAAIILFMAFLTKQTAIIVAIALSVYCFFVYQRWQRFIFPVTFFLLIGLSTAILTWLTDGWYYFYLFELPGQHEIVKSMIIGFWQYDILAPLSIAFGVALAYLIYLSTRDEKSDFGFYSLLFAIMIGGSWMARLHSGTWLNGLFTAHFIIAILFGLGLHRLLSDNLDFSTTSANDIGVKNYFSSFILIAAVLQFLLLIYLPQAYIPTQADAEAGQKFIRFLKDIEGDVFLPFPGYMLTLAGKNSCSNGPAMADIFRGKDEALKEKLKAEIIAAIHSQRYQAIITCRPWFGHFINSPAFVEEVEKFYTDAGPIFGDHANFTQVTGVKTRPDRLYLLKN